MKIVTTTGFSLTLHPAQAKAADSGRSAESNLAHLLNGLEPPQHRPLLRLHTESFSNLTLTRGAAQKDEWLPRLKRWGAYKGEEPFHYRFFSDPGTEDVLIVPPALRTLLVREGLLIRRREGWYSVTTKLMAAELTE